MQILNRTIVLAAMVVLAAGATPASAQLSALGSHRIFQNEVGGTVEAGDRFGDSLVAGDFDGDNIDDLAIGAPSEAITTIVAAGAVFVVYGSNDGLGSGPRQPLLLHQDVDGVLGQAEENDRFGSVLASGDFNGDGRGELVVGVPDEDVGADVDAGAIQIFPGSAGGVVIAGNVLHDADSFAPPSAVVPGYRLGAALAAGHLPLIGADSREDLLIGVPGGLGAPGFEGVAIMAAFSDGSLNPTQSFVTFPGGFQESGDQIGAAVAVGDIDNDGTPEDLAIGAPFADLSAGDTDEGVVWIFPESEFDYRYLPLAPPFDSHFGRKIVLGDFNNEGYDQMLIGAPETDVNGVNAAGAAISYDEPRKTFKYIVQNPENFFGTPDPIDVFGGVLAVGDFDADSHDDAAFGVPLEDVNPGGGDVPNVGIVQIAHGGDLGLTLDDNQLWVLNGPIGLSIAANDNFGAALAAGDFDGDGVDDLAIGVPGATWSGQAQTGYVLVLYGVDGGMFADDFESGDPSMWSSSAP
jgi:hypothetical protein